METAGCEQVFFSTDDHFQFALDDIGDLFMNMMMFRGDASLFYIPEHQGAGGAMNHFAKKARKCLFDRNIVKVLHIFYLSEDTEKPCMERFMRGGEIVNKWISCGGLSSLNDVDLRKFQSNENAFTPTRGCGDIRLL